MKTFCAVFSFCCFCYLPAPMAASGNIENLTHKDSDQNGNSQSELIDRDQNNPMCNPATSTRKTFKHASLPRPELLLGFVYVIGCIVYVKYRCTVISQGRYYKSRKLQGSQMGSFWPLEVIMYSYLELKLPNLKSLKMITF